MTPKIPMAVTKPAKIASMVCPAIIFAKSRIERVKGRNEIGQHFDRHERSNSTAGTPCGTEEAEEMKPCAHADDRDAQEHHPCHREGDDDVAREGEAIGDHAQQIAKQDEDEQREDEREILAPFMADILRRSCPHDS